jgi:hypothetical protein
MVCRAADFSKGSVVVDGKVLAATFVFRVGIFHRPPAHLTNLGADGREFVRGSLGAGLTWLSVRCLSSYLNFSASSSDMLAAEQARHLMHAGEGLGVTRAPLPISPLICRLFCKRSEGKIGLNETGLDAPLGLNVIAERN